MAQYDYDLFVIGAGSGGVRAARVAAGHGARVGIAEESRYGGTCVIRGCVPKKLLVYASRFRDEFAEAAGFGWKLAEPVFSWPALIAAKDAEITRLENIYRSNLEESGVHLHHSQACFVDEHTLQLADGQCVTAAKILIATGASPVLDDAIPGMQHAITSNEVLQLPELPEHIVIYGAGYIALEFASLLRGLGARVTVIYRRDRILRGFDDELRLHLQQAMVARGVELLLLSTVQHIEPQGEWLKLTLNDGSTLPCSHFMAALGRNPNTQPLQLDKAGVATGAKGRIVVNAASRTNVPHIFAVGDVTDRVNLTPVAIREGQAFADSEFGNQPTVVNHDLVPTAVFTTPEVGTVGLSEAQARTQYDQIQVYRSQFRPMKATLGGSMEKMFMKLIVDAATDRVLGVHVLGPDAGEMAQLLGIPLQMGAKKADFDATLAVHPTAAEELVTLR